MSAVALAGCAIDPNIPNQTTFQVLEDRRLTVGFVDGVYDPVIVPDGFGGEVQPFPIVGADGIQVRDEGARPLTEDDLALAQEAATRHCAEFGRSLGPLAGVFYPAEAAFVFGRCV